ncbi:MAG: flagellar biosynthetic protein FliR [Planctomycetes bacterium]|nr:flagellar biosynthetic protein FliR [Planctomycetota bacterium]
MEYLSDFIKDLPLFILIFFRIGGILMFAPVFSNTHIPLLIRIAIALILAFILYPTLDKNSHALPSELIPFALIVLKEIAIGAVVGFAASILFAAFSMAGYLLSNQIGLDMAVIADPSSLTGEEETTVSVFYNMIAILILLAINGHHYFINAIAQSFHAVPIGGFEYTAALLTKILSLFRTLFIIGIKISIPAFVVLMLSVVAMALMAKVAQEINIFVIAFPIKIIIGFIVIFVSFSLITGAMRSYIVGFEKGIMSLLSTM